MTSKSTEQPKLGILWSYTYLRDMDKVDLDWLLNHPRIEMMVDSGAYGAFWSGHTIDMDEYCAWLDEYKDRVFSYVMLDVVQQLEQSKTNLREMYRRGLKPWPVHVLGMNNKDMDELFDYSDIVCLAGLKNKKGKQAASYFKMKTEWAKGRKVHWLGYGKDYMLRALRPYSCDLSTWSSATRFGKLHVYYGSGRWELTTRQQVMSGEKRDPARELIRKMQHLNFTESDFFDDDAWRRNEKERGLLAHMNKVVTAW